MALRPTNDNENRRIRAGSVRSCEKSKLEMWGRMASCAPIGNRRPAGLWYAAAIRAGSVSDLVWSFNGER